MSRRAFWQAASVRAGAAALAGGLLGTGKSGCGTGEGAQGGQSPTKQAPGGGQFGVGASLGGRRVFPADNPWNQDISKEPVDPNSEALIASIGLDKGLHPDFGTTWGIPYVVVPGTQPRVPVRFAASDESDPGPYPIPPDAPSAGGPDDKGDRHILVIDRDDWKLYELFAASPEGKGWRAFSGAIFDLNSNKLRPAGWTSADAAGLPIFPGLVRQDEVEAQVVRHAFRFSCRRTRRAFVAPARHYASRLTDANLPPMGMRVRLKGSYDLSGFPRPAQVILTALKTYGMFLADNGGDWFLSGTPNRRWDDRAIETLKRVKGRDFEVVRMGEIVTRV
jgi:hypothetical protein